MNYFLVEIPLNADGAGPETDPKKVCSTVWQIWDEELHVLGEYPTEDEAQQEYQNLCNAPPTINKIAGAVMAFIMLLAIGATIFICLDLLCRVM